MNLKFKNYIILAEEFLQDDNLDKSEELLLKSLDYADKEEEISVYFELADIYFKKSQNLKAKECFKKILKIREMPGAYYGIAVSLDLLKEDINLVIKNYKKAIDLDNDYDRAHYYLALCYDRIGEKELAIKHLKRAIEIDEYDFISYNDLGSIYEELNQNELPKKYFEKSLKINPDYGRALFNMGVLYKKSGNNKKALDFYYKAIGKFDSPYLFLNMSAIYIEERDYKGSIKILNRGIEDFDDSCNLHYNKSCSFSLLDDKESAKEELLKAIDIKKEALDWALYDNDLKEIAKEIKWSL